jgi:hypothetical protein
MLDAEGQRQPDQGPHDARAGRKDPGELAFCRLRHLVAAQWMPGSITPISSDQRSLFSNSTRNVWCDTLFLGQVERAGL